MFLDYSRYLINNAKNNIINLKNRILNNKPETENTKEKLNPAFIPKYVNQLAKPPVYRPLTVKNFRSRNIKKHCCKHFYIVDISEFKEQILPEGFPKTDVWGYGGLVKNPVSGRMKYLRSSPGATFEAVRGIPVKVKWINRLKGKHLFAVDPTLHWANPNGMPMEPKKPWPLFPPGFLKAQKPVPVVTHLHGGETPSIYDGHPDTWFTYNGKTGPSFHTSTYTYPNKQEPTTLWYHDHALGITRLNVYAGLAGFYLLRDDRKCRNGYFRLEGDLKLPRGKYEIPIVIQDRMFYTDGSLLFNNTGVNPEDHPYWVPEFFGDTIMVNGKVWPNLDVERHQYRFRLLNGSNARFYNLKMSNGMKMIQIGSDGGFLSKPVTLDTLLLAPGERADIIVDFTGIVPGTSITLLNDAKAPYPDGDSPDPDTVGQIMQFYVPLSVLEPAKPHKLPEYLNDIPVLRPDAPGRTLTLYEVSGPNGPLEVLLNGQKWSDKITETPEVGSTQEWTIVNLTMDTHPIHLHLIQFQMLNRQDIDVTAYRKRWEEINGTPPFINPPQELSVEPYLIGDPIKPDDNETGWKDTFRMNPGQVTRILVRFAPQDVPVDAVKPGENLFPFDPACGPGYVWHCHIIDHEDNEMMRPYKVKVTKNE